MNEVFLQEYLYVFGPTIILSLALAAVAVSYVVLLVRLGKSEKDKVFLQSKIRDQTSQILMDAHQRRLKIVQEALEKAGTIIKDTQVVDFDLKSQFISDLQDMKKKQEELLRQRHEQISALYDQFENSLRRETSDQLKSISKNMETKAEEGIVQFRQLIEGEKIAISKQLSQKYEEQYKIVQKAIEDYKTNQVKKVDKRVFDILQALTHDVLGRSLTLKDHEELVQKALIQMKTDMNVEE